jgi:nucleoid-associated protein YgaU
VSAPATWPTTPTGNPAVTPTMPTGTTTMPTGTAADPAASQSASAPAGPAQSPGPSGAAVQVRAGDCLWLIAARRLGPGATPAQVAASWPAWYAANRSVIGADPRVVRPGELLVPPTVLDAKTSSGASDNPTWRTTKGWTP